MKNKKILNVACGNDTYGTDFVDLYPSRSEVIKWDGEKDRLPFPNGTFDEVYSAFFVEHLKNTHLALNEMVRVLKKGGKLIIKTDNAGFWAFHNEKSTVKVHYGGYGSKGSLDKHYSLFTTEHLKNHFESLGLKITKVEYFKGATGPIVNVVSWLLSKTRFRPMAYPHILIEGIKE